MSSSMPAPEVGNPPPATASQTREFLLERSGRSFAPIPNSFIQNPDRSLSHRSAPLADFVRRGDRRGLTTLLFLYALISRDDQERGWSATLALQVWARALDTTATASGASASSAATKIFTRLVKAKLIERRRSGRARQVTITLLRGDGSGDPYTRPVGRTKDDYFTKLNYRFWTEDWAQTLSLPAIAMLLVALHEKPDFPLPTERVPDWYGWSADTAERGLRELREKGLIGVVKDVYTDPISPTGISARNIYTVREPFDRATVDRDAATLSKARR